MDVNAPVFEFKPNNLGNAGKKEEKKQKEYMVCKLHKYLTISGDYLVPCYVLNSNDYTNKLVVIEGSPEDIAIFIKKNIEIFKKGPLLLIVVVENKREDISTIQRLVSQNKNWKMIAYVYLEEILLQVTKLVEQTRNINTTIKQTAEAYLESLREEDKCNKQIFEIKIKQFISQNN